MYLPIGQVQFQATNQHGPRYLRNTRVFTLDMALFPRAVLMLLFSGAAIAQPSWPQFGQNAQHSAPATTPSQKLARIVWQTSVDLAPQLSGNELLIHYGSPLVTAENTVIVPVKTSVTGGFRVDARDGSNGVLEWSQTSDYILPPHNWTPEFAPALTPTRVYFPGAGGTVYYRENPDSATGNSGQLAFYGLSNYQADTAIYNSNVIINTPLTADRQGDVYFGFVVLGATPAGLASGIAMISAAGEGSWVAVTSASGDSTMTEVKQNSAPALSSDQQTLYVAISNGTAGYLAALNAATLAPIAHIALTDPKSGQAAWLDDDGSASPTIGSDGDVYYGVLETPPMENNYRGWLLHFDAGLQTVKTPGSFGWDDTASPVPSALVPSYHGSSKYLLMTKYNNYINTGGNGENRIAILDPNATETDSINGATVMKEVLTILGPTPSTLGGVKEWCVNSAAVDLPGSSVLVGSEDGKLYRWDLKTNTLSESIALTLGIGEAYTPTIVAPDGKVYAINNATLFAVGETRPVGRARTNH